MTEVDQILYVNLNFYLLELYQLLSAQGTQNSLGMCIIRSKNVMISHEIIVIAHAFLEGEVCNA
jgi:hypothetical protein